MASVDVERLVRAGDMVRRVKARGSVVRVYATGDGITVSVADSSSKCAVDVPAPGVGEWAAHVHDVPKFIALCKALKTGSGVATVELDGEHFSLNGAAVGVEVDADDNDWGFELSSATVEAAAWSVFCKRLAAHADADRPPINNSRLVFADGYCIGESTDRFRVARLRVPVSDGLSGEFLPDAKCLARIASTFVGAVSLGSSSCEFHMSDGVVRASVKLEHVDWPSLSRFWAGERGVKFAGPFKELRAVVREVLSVAGKNRMIHVRVYDGRGMVVATEGVWRFVAGAAHGDVALACNGKYLLDLLAVADDGATIEFDNCVKPFACVDADGFGGMLVPMLPPNDDGVIEFPFPSVDDLPVSEAGVEPVAEPEPQPEPEETAGAEPEPVAEPTAETVEIPEVPPVANDKAKVLMVSESVIPAGVKASDIPALAGFPRRKFFRDGKGRKVCYAAAVEGRCVVVWRDWFDRSDELLEKTVTEWCMARGFARAA